MEPKNDTRQTAMDKTEHERLVYLQMEAAARDLYEKADAMCGDLRKLAGIPAAIARGGTSEPHVELGAWVVD
jgi:hypothetical protein